MKITEAKQKTPWLLHYIGNTAYNTLCDHYGSTDPSTKTYDDLTAKLKELYAPAALEITENYKFNCRKQQSGEDAQSFANALTKLSTTCKFGTFQQTAIRKQFVFGLANRRIQGRLLETMELTFDKALQVAISMELCEKETNALRSDTVSVDYLHANGNHYKKSKKKVFGNKNAHSTNEKQIQVKSEAK